MGVNSGGVRNGEDEHDWRHCHHLPYSLLHLRPPFHVVSVSHGARSFLSGGCGHASPALSPESRVRDRACPGGRKERRHCRVPPEEAGVRRGQLTWPRPRGWAVGRAAPSSPTVGWQVGASLSGSRGWQPVGSPPPAEPRPPTRSRCRHPGRLTQSVIKTKMKSS